MKKCPESGKACIIGCHESWCFMTRENNFYQVLKRRYEMNSNETYKCKCLWRKAGLGAEVAQAHQSCPIHGIGGPMPMFVSSEIGRQAGVIKGKHEGATIDLSEVPTSVLEKIVKRGNATAAEHAEWEKRVDFYNRAFGILKIEVTDAAIQGMDSSSCETGQTLYVDPRAEKLVSEVGGIGKQADDRHTFSSGASSSGRKPPYTAITQLCLERFANQRGYGDTKYGIDNWKKGARDKQFILDRINHGIEHLIRLGEQVKMDDAGVWTPGHDDAAAVCCAAMFVMEWQKEMREHTEMMHSLRMREETQVKTDKRRVPEEDLGKYRG